ncbi:hypothetical protein P4O66_001512 [Electrophorus voltai]|uniref:PiggyBac transposable element-derived protein domain-containing protein n=1 Tax=Electrophorus voltai TaxID=2609070 RepID=A0AAD8Z713_9TELE|nr:hypothetical protein P4O66_001512 [Electrophorus voltai]
MDKRMLATKASISMKQHMKDKPTKWGYKLFVLANSSKGYTFNFSVYEGNARKPSGKGLSFDAVVNLIHVSSLGTGYTVYVDNFNTSSLLFCHLCGIGFGACETILENRIGFPKTSANALPKQAARGNMRWIRDGPLLFVKWRDTQDVTMCPTVHKAYSGKTAATDIAVVNSIIQKEMALAEAPQPKLLSGRCCVHSWLVLGDHRNPHGQKHQVPLRLPLMSQSRDQGCFPVPVCELSTEWVDLQDEPLENPDLVIRPRDREAAGPAPGEAEADGPLHDLKSGDWVVIKDLRRSRWNKPRWLGPAQ